MNPNEIRLVICVDEIDSSFIFGEIDYYSTKFKEVLIVSKKKLNIELFGKKNIVNLALSEINNQRQSSFASMRLLFTDLFSKYTSASYLKKFRYNLAYLKQAQQAANMLKLNIDQNTPSVYLSYWFADWALVLSILKKQRVISHYYSRAHGRDLFEYREPMTGKLPFRIFQLNMANGIFPVSQAGTDYLKSRYPEYAKKIKTHYLGTVDNGLNPFDEKAVFTIVTCARVRDVKRIYLVPELLKKLDFEVRWIHIGDENLRDKKDDTIQLYLNNKESLKQHSNVKAEFKGFMTNQQVFEFYNQTPVNLFLNVSSTEGLPVVLIEAISMGIPVMATDVGGCNELVNEKTGILIEKNFGIEEVANLIQEFKYSNQNTLEFREGVREFWKRNFESFNNYNNLINDVISSNIKNNNL